MAYADESVRQLLRREGFRWFSGRPERPLGDAAARSAFRSEFAVRVRPRVREMSGAGALSQPVEVWFQDAACGSLGKAVGLVSERANTADIGAAVAPGSVGVAVLDGAGWHRGHKLAPPDNIVLLTLPPYSPELNPMETVFRYPRDNRLANRMFADVAAVAEACRKAWEWFATAPNRIASIMRRKWAIAPSPPIPAKMNEYQL